MKKINQSIVFIPGILGSALHNAKNNNYFFTIRELLGIKNCSLSLPLQWENQQQLHDEFTPCGPITTLGGLGVYQGIIKKLKKKYTHFYFFDYDWRRELSETTEHFIEYLEEIYEKHGPTSILSHSMGGLIAFSALNKNLYMADSVLFTGVPFGGDVGYGIDMHQGASLGLNKKILCSTSQFSFSSTYSFFPENQSHIVDTNGSSLPFNWFSSEDWARYQFSVFQDKSIDIEVNKKHLGIALNKAKDFRKTIMPTEVFVASKIKIAVLRSQCHPTTHQLILNPDNHHWDFDNGEKLSGDGRVTFENAAVPKPLEYRDFHTSKTHAWLYTDFKKIDEILHYFHSG